MKKNTKIVGVCILLFGLQGCATMPGQSDTPEVAPSSVYDTIVEHTIEPGDRLVDLAAKYTGDANQWSAIAAYNGITDPRTLKIGDVIAIPYSLIPEELRTELLKLSARNFDNTSASMEVAGNQSSADTPGTLPVAPTNTLALKREPAPAASDVVVQSVSINRTFELKPMDVADLRNTESMFSDSPKVRVVGTYYPKGVYQQPASYSTLLMRVAPGTVFELEREVNDWYKVVTADGVGYLRAVDGNIVRPN